MSELGFFFSIIPTLLSGLPLTLQLAGTSLALGFIFALGLALAQQGDHRVLV